MSTSLYILAIDQGTTGTRAIVYDHSGRMRGSAHQEFHQYYPQPGWVEHDPLEIWKTTVSVIDRSLSKAGISFLRIASVGITNQRETTVLWERKTGRPVSRAIVWQDRRTAQICAGLKARGLEGLFRERTGLVLDPYFSGTKIQWMLNTISQLRRKAARGDVLFGTIDTWLLWNLTGGKMHATDVTNASRTLLLNIKKICWDRELLKILRIPSAILPEVHPSSFSFGKSVAIASLKQGVPINAMAGDQQAALYGQGCYHSGEAKNTYGTGCFLMTNEGKSYRKPPRGLLGTLACDAQGKPAYALEGAVFIGGAVVQWLRDGLGFIKRASETEKIARQIKDTGGVIIVPAFTGLGSPYWNPNVRGAIFGLTRGTARGHLIKAALESIAFQTADVFEAMGRSLGKKLRSLKVDGGATTNDYLMQFQADLLGVPVLRSDRPESTAWGAAKLAGVACGFWKDLRDADRTVRYKKFAPRMSRRVRLAKREAWRSAVRTLLAQP